MSISINHQHVTGAEWTELPVNRQNIVIQNRGKATVHIHTGDTAPAGINAPAMRMRPLPNEPLTLTVPADHRVYARVYSTHTTRSSIVAWSESGTPIPLTFAFAPGVGALIVEGPAPTVELTEEE
jgi:hypothetical protein